MKLLVIVGTLMVLPGMAFAQCEQPNGNDELDDSRAIECLLNLTPGGTVVLNADVTYGYYIGQTVILRTSGVTFTSTSQWGYRALLIAMPNLNGNIFEVQDGTISDYTISRIWFYGDKYDRVNPPCGSDDAANVRLRGTRFTVDDVESAAAPCATSMVLDGTTSDFEVRDSWFANNGWPEGSGHGSNWADGLTLNQCRNGWVHHNHFVDNTDVDLVTGGTGNDRWCVIENNFIDHYQWHGFGGIHVGWFPSDIPGVAGNHSGLRVSGNTINSGYNHLAFGLVVGSHPWSMDPLKQATHAGSVFSNGMSGAVVNLGVDGAFAGGSVTGNTYTGNQGNWGLYCTASMNYGAGHNGGATVEGGFTPFKWDNGNCGYLY